MNAQENANRISDELVAIALREVEQGTHGHIIAVGFCLALRGVLNGAEMEVPSLVEALETTIAAITGHGHIELHEKPAQA